MQFFYIHPGDLKRGILSEEESKHCLKVLRKKEGDVIDLLDGVGGVHKAEIQGKLGKKCVVKVLESSTEEDITPDLHLFFAPTKNLDRVEFLIEKACELGVKSLTPVFTHNTERKHLNVEKLRKRMHSACKQSMTLYFPELNDPIKFKEVLGKESTNKLIGHCYDYTTPHLKTKVSKERTNVLIGPEGDFSQEEVAAAIASGYEAVTMGHKRLRTETAAIFVCTCFNLQG